MTAATAEAGGESEKQTIPIAGAEGGNEAQTIPAGLAYERNDDGGVTITKYTGNAATLTIPATIEGLAVTHLGSYVFSECTNLTGVTFAAGSAITEANFSSNAPFPGYFAEQIFNRRLRRRGHLYAGERRYHMDEDAVSEEAGGLFYRGFMSYAFHWELR